MNFTKVILLLGSMLTCLELMAHPVSYKGSRGLMGQHSSQMSHNQLNYSFEYWMAMGFHHFQRPQIEDARASFASANFLLHRWNEEDLQANIYTAVGAGASGLGGTEESSGLGLIQFDIEDRDYYFLAKHLEIFNEKRSDFQQKVVRAGFAPYVENFDGIHSWLILEWQESRFFQERKNTEVTPFLRIFYQNLLFEIGQSFDGVTKFNYITHF